MASPPTPACTISVAYGAAEAGAGSVHRSMIFTNTGSAPCELNEYASAQFIGPDGHAQVGALTRIPGGGGVLAPKASMTSTMTSTDTSQFDEDRCGPKPISGLRIAPPADAAPTTLPSPVGATVCDGAIHGQLTFTTLTRN